MLHRSNIIFNWRKKEHYRIDFYSTKRGMFYAQESRMASIYPKWCCARTFRTGWARRGPITWRRWRTTDCFPSTPSGSCATATCACISRPRLRCINEFGARSACVLAERGVCESSRIGIFTRRNFIYIDSLIYTFDGSLLFFVLRVCLFEKIIFLQVTRKSIRALKIC